MKVYMTKVFMNGGSQAVRIPAEIRFEDPEVFIWKDTLGRINMANHAPNTWDTFFEMVHDLKAEPDDGSGSEFSSLLEQIRHESSFDDAGISNKKGRK